MLSCCVFVSLPTESPEELLTSFGHSGPMRPLGLRAFFRLSMCALNFALILGSILEPFLDQNSIIFQRFFESIFKLRFWSDYWCVFVICLYLWCLKITFLLQKNSYFQGFTCILKVLIFSIFFGQKNIKNLSTNLYPKSMRKCVNNWARNRHKIHKKHDKICNFDHACKSLKIVVFLQ